MEQYGDLKHNMTKQINGMTSDINIAAPTVLKTVPPRSLWFSSIPPLKPIASNR